MPQIYKLKVKKSRVGKVVPFPLLYLFPASLLERMQQSFSSFIGFPVRHQINIPWGDLVVDINARGVTRSNSSSCGKSLDKVLPDLYRKENPWHIAVPILNRNKPPQPKKFTNSSNNDPRELYGGQVDYTEEEPPVLGYVKDRTWLNFSEENGATPAYPPTAYFATKDEVHTPICSVCPRLPFHVSGQCRVGDKACFKAFRNHFAPNMFSKLRAYDKFLEGRTNSQENQ